MLYLECNCNHNSASCFCANSPLWGGAEGARGRLSVQCETQGGIRPLVWSQSTAHREEHGHISTSPPNIAEPDGWVLVQARGASWQGGVCGSDPWYLSQVFGLAPRMVAWRQVWCDPNDFGAGRKEAGGEECEKDKIMTEKEDRTVSGLAQSRDLLESQEEDKLKRSQYCVCNNILCDCDENPESKSLLGNCWVEN